MDQLSNNFQERQSLTLSLDFEQLHNLSLEFSPSESRTSVDGIVNACEMEPEGPSLPQLGINLNPYEQQHAAANDLVAMPLDVPSSSNQIFLTSLNADTNKLLPSSQRRELSLRICRSHNYCVICQQSIKRKSVVYGLRCRHYFHRECLKKWHQKHSTCPLCRNQL